MIKTRLLGPGIPESIILIGNIHYPASTFRLERITMQLVEIKYF